MVVGADLGRSGTCLDAHSDWRKATLSLLTWLMRLKAGLNAMLSLASRQLARVLYAQRGASYNLALSPYFCEFVRRAHGGGHFCTLAP